MAARSSATEWGSVAKAFHWLTGLLVVGMVALGWTMAAVTDNALKYELFQWHKSFGFTILGLTVLRLLWRLTGPTPALPGHMSLAERAAATLTHWGLYLVLFALTFTGWVAISTSAFQVPTLWFGLVPIPNLMGPDQELHKSAEGVHEALVWVLIALFVLHVAGALFHHFVRRDQVLRRMLPFSRA
ncbi:cytochrome b [Zavarzinia sp. CC-PAN008]|uniref:cytochrome b n=1 Tax=Zavarzinia sp. CC-PAN008 TaxID=3243332 RepID=UPI003F749F40